jgi:hypothetical protein
MTGYDQEAVGHLFATGLEYYVAGRCAAQCHLSRVAGNILHHAIEMLLKSELAKQAGLDELKSKYGHKLDKLWHAVKEQHPDEDLTCFDQLVAGLHSFETVRYPNDYMKRGAAFSIDWSPTTITSEQTGPNVPRYALLMAEIDALVARLFKVCHMNPKYFWGGAGSATTDAIGFQNNEAGDWF